MPVYKLVDEMSYEEFLGWMNFLERRPIGWRDDDRVFKVLQTQGVKERAWSVFPSLRPIYKEAEASRVNEDGSIKMESLKGSALFSKMLGATKGDKIDL